MFARKDRVLASPLSDLRGYDRITCGPVREQLDAPLRVRVGRDDLVEPV